MINISIKIKKRYQGRQYNVNKDKINKYIPHNRLLVLLSDGQKLGVLGKQEALLEAGKRNLDLVLISEKSEIPVAKIIDYGKFKYQRKKRAEEIKKNNKIVEQKEIRLTANIDNHDLEVKLKQAKKFLEKGDRLKISLRFKGRQMANKEVGYRKMTNFIEQLVDISKVEKKPQLNGRFYNAYLSSLIKNKKN